jgi:LuxR family maltose regulon positive regulatory protein
MGKGHLSHYCQKLVEAFALEHLTNNKRAKTILLSKRETELLGLIATGRSNKEIAGELFISIGTVKRHTVNIFNKLEVKNRTEAVAKGRELGLL